MRTTTIVVVVFRSTVHLGEKQTFGRNARCGKMGLRVSGPIIGAGITPVQRSNRPVEAIRLFPTLVELAGLPPDATSRATASSM